MRKGGVCLAVGLMGALLVGCEPEKLTVVTPEKPTTSEAFAARELQYHMRKATGRDVPVVSESAVPFEGRRFFVGNVKALDAVGVRYDAFHVEERLVKGVGRDVYFAGGELPDYDRARGRAKDYDTYGLAGGGTLYAVYDFLEKDMGVRWIWPGELGEVIPKRPVPVLDGVERRGVEPLVERCLRGDLEATRRISIANRLWGWKDPENARREVQARRLWLTRNRVGKRRKFLFGHAFTAWPNKYVNHPEYFAQQPSGLRGHFADSKPGEDVNKYYPLCVSNPTVHEMIVGAWKRSNAGNFKLGVRPPYINCCENDSPGFCTCERCRAWDADDPRFKTHPYWNGTVKDVQKENRSFMAKEQWGEDGAALEGCEPPSVSDRYVRFYNAIVEKARRVHPLAGVCAYAYSNYRLPPKETKVAEGVVLGFVPGVIFPYGDAESAEFRRNWGGWNAMGAQEMRYRPNYMFGGGSMPYSSAKHMASDINFAFAHGLFAIDQDSLLGAWSAQAMKNYVAARILRAPDTSYETMFGEFLSAFGKGADDVRRYCEMLEALNDRMSEDEWTRLGKSNPTKKGFPGGTWKNFVLNVADFYSEKWFADADRLLVAAAEKTDGAERARVEFLRKGLRDGLLTYRTRVAQKSGDKAKFAEAFRTLVDYRASVEADGVCAYAWFADAEDTHAGWPHKTQKYYQSKEH